MSENNYITNNEMANMYNDPKTVLFQQFNNVAYFFSHATKARTSGTTIKPPNTHRVPKPSTTPVPVADGRASSADVFVLINFEVDLRFTSSSFRYSCSLAAMAAVSLMVSGFFLSHKHSLQSTKSALLHVYCEFQI